MATMTKASTLKAIRLTHHYSGVFLAPAILFFAITGGLQMFGLHESSRGSSYVPPALLVHLAQLHKKGTLYLPPRRAQAAPAATSPANSKADAAAPKAEGGSKSEGGFKPDAGRSQQSGPAQPPHNPLPIKIFFGLTAFGLVVSTISGLIMAWKYTRRKGLVVGTLLAGVVVPLLLLLV